MKAGDIVLRPLVTVAALLFLTAQSPKPLTGIALVIGEASYQHLPQLSNAVADAAAVAETLQSLGFETTITSNISARKLGRAVDNFLDDAADTDVAVIYYAGHGIEAGGENWLVPIDADVSALDETDGRLLRLSGIIDQLGGTVPVTIVFLDACRSSPFPPGATFRRKDGVAVAIGAAGLVATRGAADASAPSARDTLGIVVGFSTEPGEAALDGPKGGNSPYAAALVRHLTAMNGAEFGIVMRMVTEEVYLKTQGIQRPWTNESLTRLLYLGGKAPFPDGDEGRILRERRQLLLTMTQLSAPQREQVEAESRSAGVPMDALYGLLKSLGSEVPSDRDQLEKVLDAQADRIKGILATENALASDDPDIANLYRLAEKALSEGALDAYVAIWERARARYAEASKRLDVVETKLRARRLEGGEILAGAAAAHELKADYRAAARYYGEAFAQVARWDTAKAWEYKRREADAWLSLGDEKGNGAAVETSIVAFREALALAPREREPLLWALTENNLGNALLVRSRGETSNASIEEAIRHYRMALEVRNQKQHRDLWAKTQNNIAIAITELAERNGEPWLLDGSISAYRAALSVTSRQSDPLVWATVVSNLGNALERKGGEGLQEAISLHRQALGERTRDHLPVLWAMSQENLGNALTSLGRAHADPALVKEGIASYRLALGVIERSSLPMNWAGLQYNLGNALGTLSEFESRPDNLAAAAAAYREALREESLERSPASWAKIQYMLGKRLWEFGEEKADVVIRQQAIDAFRQSLRYYTRDRNEADWAITMYEIGVRLHRLGLLTNDVGSLAEAVSLLRDSLGYYTRERNSQEWAETLSSLASALADHGFAAGNQKHIDEAIANYHEVTSVQSRAADPLKWAATQTNLAAALYYSAINRNNDGQAREGRQALVMAAEEFKAHNDISRAQAALALLDSFDKLIADLPP